MQSLKQTLKKELKNARKVALLGVGSELRGDDAAGVLVAKQLLRLRRAIKGPGRLTIFMGATAPENLTGEIKRFNPSHLIIVDSADLGKPAGTVRLITPDKAGGISFCTHQLPLKIMVDYLQSAIGCEIMIIGIQPEKIEFGVSVSKKIQASVRRVADAVQASLSAVRRLGKTEKGRVEQ